MSSSVLHKSGKSESSGRGIGGGGGRGRGQDVGRGGGRGRGQDVGRGGGRGRGQDVGRGGGRGRGQDGGRGGGRGNGQGRGRGGGRGCKRHATGATAAFDQAFGLDTAGAKILTVQYIIGGIESQNILVQPPAWSNGRADLMHLVPHSKKTPHAYHADDERYLFYMWYAQNLARALTCFQCVCIYLVDPSTKFFKEERKAEIESYLAVNPFPNREERVRRLVTALSTYPLPPDYDIKPEMDWIFALMQVSMDEGVIGALSTLMEIEAPSWSDICKDWKDNTQTWLGREGYINGFMFSDLHLQQPEGDIAASGGGGGGGGGGDGADGDGAEGDGAEGDGAEGDGAEGDGAEGCDEEGDEEH